MIDYRLVHIPSGFIFFRRQLHHSSKCEIISSFSRLLLTMRSQSAFGRLFLPISGALIAIVRARNRFWARWALISTKLGFYLFILAQELEFKIIFLKFEVLPHCWISTYPRCTEYHLIPTGWREEVFSSGFSSLSVHCFWNQCQCIRIN